MSNSLGYFKSLLLQLTDLLLSFFCVKKDVKKHKLLCAKCTIAFVQLIGLCVWGPVIG